jgi:GTPase SAR1 family protein
MLENEINNLMESSNFNNNKVKRLKELKKLSKKNLTDYRMVLNPSLIETDLEFNPEKETASVYAFYNPLDEIIGSCHFFITPKIIAKKEKFIMKGDTPKTIKIAGYKEILGVEKLPEFIFTFGYFVILPQYRSNTSNNIIASGLNIVSILKKVLHKIQTHAPDNTWFIIVVGSDSEPLPLEMYPIGTQIKVEQLDYNFNWFANNKNGNKFTYWLAEKYLKITKLQNTSDFCLNPIFVKRLN